eukprot:15102972-Alexandrium_andersonii.AAC.1
MSASLVGSEMCIRDRSNFKQLRAGTACGGMWCAWACSFEQLRAASSSFDCLLYTSDAADDM